MSTDVNVNQCFMCDDDDDNYYELPKEFYLAASRKCSEEGSYKALMECFRCNDLYIQYAGFNGDEIEFYSSEIPIDDTPEDLEKLDRFKTINYKGE